MKYRLKNEYMGRQAGTVLDATRVTPAMLTLKDATGEFSVPAAHAMPVKDDGTAGSDPPVQSSQVSAASDEELATELKQRGYRITSYHERTPPSPGNDFTIWEKVTDKTNGKEYVVTMVDDDIVAGVAQDGSTLAAVYQSFNHLSIATDGPDGSGQFPSDPATESATHKIVDHNTETLAKGLYRDYSNAFGGLWETPDEHFDSGNNGSATSANAWRAAARSILDGNYEDQPAEDPDQATLFDDLTKDEPQPADDDTGGN